MHYVHRIVRRISAYLRRVRYFFADRFCVTTASVERRHARFKLAIMAPETACEAGLRRIRLQGLSTSGRRIERGPKKIQAMFKRLHTDITAPSLHTLEKILRRCRLTEKRKRIRRNSADRVKQRNEAQRPNPVRTVDLKRWLFAMRGQSIGGTHRRAEMCTSDSL